MKQINFFCEDVSFVLKKKKLLRQWILEVVQAHEQTVMAVNYIFCSDEYLYKLNQKFLQHDYFTDIITFNNSPDQQDLVADIFISIDRVSDNAQQIKIDFNQELYRVMIHGILHLLGYSDQTPFEKTVMREKENSSLSLLKL